MVNVVTYDIDDKTADRVDRFLQDFNLISTAIPVITSEFNSIRDVGWYGVAFQLAL